MKKIIAIIAVLICGVTAIAQPARGTYGTIQPFANQTGLLFKANGTQVASGKLDTLTNTDTGYVRFTFSNQYNKLFVFKATKISGTLGGSLQLQGSPDNSDWYTVAGDTSICTTCVGLTGTVTNTAGTKSYAWQLPLSHNPCFVYFRIRWITTGTMTGSYTGISYYDY